MSPGGTSSIILVVGRGTVAVVGIDEEVDKINTVVDTKYILDGEVIMRAEYSVLVKLLYDEE